MIHHQVPAELRQEELSRYLKRAWPLLPSHLLRDLLKKKDVRVNGVKSGKGDMVHGGDSLDIYAPEKHFTLPADALFYDSKLLAVVKPQGLPSLPDAEGVGADTMELRAKRIHPEAKLCHRLDAATGGVMLCAVDENVYEQLLTAFREHGLRKTYRALLTACPKQFAAYQKQPTVCPTKPAAHPMEPTAYPTKHAACSAQPAACQTQLTAHSKSSACPTQPAAHATQKEITLHAYLLKDARRASVRVTDKPVSGAKEIVTRVKLLGERDGLWEVELEPVTGRTHQLRAHMAHIGCPILGDDKYGDREKNRALGFAGRLCLWCETMEIPEESGVTAYEGMRFHSACPDWLKKQENR